MSDLIERFDTEYIEYHGMSEGHRRACLKTLRDFSEHAGIPLDQCGADEFKAFMAHLLGQDFHVNTVRWRGNHIRAFFGWAFDSKVVNGDTLMEVKRVKNPRGATGTSKPKPYSQKELRQFWVSLDERWPKTSPLLLRRWRNRTSAYRKVHRHMMRIQIECIARLALDCGLRRQEIYALTLDDVTPDNFYIVVTNGKRANAREDKPREVPFTKESRMAVERWLEARAEVLRWHKAKDHGSVWLCLMNPGPTKPMRWERFERIIATVGPFTLHRFRHTCATHWVRVGVDIEVVSRLLGHATVQQTLAYAELAREDIHAAVHKHEDAFEKLAAA